MQQCGELRMSPGLCLGGKDWGHAHKVEITPMQYSSGQQGGAHMGVHYKRITLMCPHTKTVCWQGAGGPYGSWCGLCGMQPPGALKLDSPALDTDLND